MVAAGVIVAIGAACSPSTPDAPAGSTASSTAEGSLETPSRNVCVAPDKGRWEPVPVGAAKFVVNRGTHGMTAQIRWAMSPDSAALLVVEDPVGAESEPVPDGALFVTEHTGRTWRMDSVWSVAPSPDWRQLAVGRAVVIPGGEEQVVPESAWTAPARRLAELGGAHPALHADSLRAHSYPLSGMAVVEGTAITITADVDLLPAPAARFASLDGWRVGWSCDGRALLVGDRPQQVSDDEPATNTRRVAWPTRSAGATSTAPADSVRWTTGPTIQIGAPSADSGAGTFVVRGRRIEGRGGRVIVHGTDRTGTPTERDIGAGRPLAATRGGRFILALAPRANARPSESPEHAVVYRVP